MASSKTGFSYYNVDTDRYQDIRIKRLKKELGCSGIAVYDYILTEIYRVKGCFIEWDSNTAFDVADYFGIKETLVSEIVNYCCNVGLFDKALLVRENVLSSKAIQKRFLDMSSRAKRINAKIPEEYDIITEVTPIIPDKPVDTSGSLPQSKEEENKVKESITPHTPQGDVASVDATDVEDAEVIEAIEVEEFSPKRKKVAPKKEKAPPAIEEFVDFGLAKIPGVLPSNTEAWTNSLVLKYESWQSKGWRAGKGEGRPIINWKSTLLNTIPHLTPVFTVSRTDGSKLAHNATVMNRAFGM